MNCDEARQRWHAHLDEGRDDPALDSHLVSCEACRRYGEQLGRIVSVLDELRDETESIVAGRAGRLVDEGEIRTHGLWRAFVRPAMGIAAAVAVLVGTSLFYWGDRQVVIPPRVGTASVDRSHDQDSGVISPAPPRLGLSLRGESARRFLAVARPVSQDNVQVFWLYPILASDSKGDPRGR